jgi:hypothetical protein
VCQQTTNNTRKIAAMVGSVGAGLQALLWTEYHFPMADEPHVFVPIQTAARTWWNTYMYNNSHQINNDISSITSSSSSTSVQQQQQPSTTTTATTTRSPPPPPAKQQP